MEFCVAESCARDTLSHWISAVSNIDRIVADQDRDNNLILLHDLCDTMEAGSLCAMGGTRLSGAQCTGPLCGDFDHCWR